jgi:hypothetical protein
MYKERRAKEFLGLERWVRCLGNTIPLHSREYLGQSIAKASSSLGFL